MGREAGVGTGGIETEDGRLMSEEQIDFDVAFRALNPGGFDPFPWQRRLYDRIRGGDWPDACDIPTGLGKTSAVICWCSRF